MSALIHSGQTKRQVSQKTFDDNWAKTFRKKTEIKEKTERKEVEKTKEEQDV